MSTEIKKNGKPFLRWAGGKNWLVKDIGGYIPKNGFNKYIEPFVGGGSVFFHLAPNSGILSDLNQELIESYEVLKGDVKLLIEELSRYENTEEFYYKIRSKKPRTSIKKAARFIYLNQTSFNGIYRVNQKGEYNVPYGYRKKNFLQPDNLLQASFLLQNIELKTRDFKSSLDDIEKNDFVFLDPPYTVSHNNNGFIKYNSKLFDLDAQYDLSSFLDAVQEIGAKYLLTNAAHQVVKQIFSKPGSNKIIEKSRASLVGGLNAKRAKYQEYLITNIETNG